MHCTAKIEKKLWGRGTADSMATLFPLRAPQKPWQSSWRPDLKDNNGYWNLFQETLLPHPPPSHRTTTTHCWKLTVFDSNHLYPFISLFLILEKHGTTNETRASLVAQTVKNLPAIQKTGFAPWVRKIPWRREWQPTQIFLPGEFHEQRCLVGWGHKESDTTE